MWLDMGKVWMMRYSHISWSWGVGALVLAGMLTSCASAPPPTDRLAATAAAIRAAQEVGARGVPQASLYLQLAKEESEQASDLVASNQVDRASYVLLRAQSDAELALALARDNEMKLQAHQAMQRVQALGQGSHQNQGTP